MLVNNEVKRHAVRNKEPTASQAASVSVVIPCFNHGRFLFRALNNVRQQTLPPARIVIVDDGSTDEATREACDRARAEGITVVSQFHLGLPAARNRGFAETDTPYLLPLDADDRLAPQTIELLRSALAETPEAGYAYSWVQNTGMYTDVWQCPPYNLLTLLRRNLSCATALIRRQAWEEAGRYDETFSEGFEDWDLWLSMAERGWTGVCVPRVMFYYNRRPSSLLAACGAGDARRGLVSRLIAKHRDLYQRHWTSLLTEWSQEAHEINERFNSPRLRKVWRLLHTGVSTLTRVQEFSKCVKGRALRVRSLANDRFLFLLSGFERGGLERQTRMVARTLVAQGVEADICALGSTQAPSTGVYSCLSPGNVLDLVACRGYRVVATMGTEECTRLLRRTGTPVMWILQNCYAWLTPEQLASLGDLASQAGRILCVSETVREYFHHYAAIPYERVEVIPNGVDPVVISSIDRRECQRNLRDQLGLADDTRILVYAGRLHPVKGVHHLLRAGRALIAQGRFLHLVVSGSYDSHEYECYLSQEIQSLGISRFVHLLPYTVQPERILAAGDFFVLPSLCEGWSLSATEAACLGLPCVLSDTGGARELLEAGAAVRIVSHPYGDPLNFHGYRYQASFFRRLDRFVDDLAESIASVMDDLEEMQCRADRAAATLVERYSVENVAMEYLRLLRETASG